MCSVSSLLRRSPTASEGENRPSGPEACGVQI